MTQPVQFVTLGIDRDVFAVPVANVQEILDLVPVARLPQAGPPLLQRQKKENQRLTPKRPQARVLAIEGGSAMKTAARTRPAGAAQGEPAETPQRSRRKAYHAPRLTDHGTLRDLTRGDFGGATDIDIPDTGSIPT